MSIRRRPLDRLIDETTALMLPEFDAGTRFPVRGERDPGQTGLGPALLEKAAG